MKVLISHPTGNANTKAVIEGVYRTKKLLSFYTTIALFKGQLLFNLGNKPPFKELHRRAFPIGWREYTKSNFFREAGRLLFSKLGWKNMITHEKGFFCIDKVYKNHDSWVASNLRLEQQKGLNAVYCYEDGALDTFKKAQELGIQCIYDLPIGYWKAARMLLQQELDNNPAWASTITGFRDSNVKLARKDQELAKADRIFVASTFTKETLNYYEGKLPKIEVVPYGFPKVVENRNYEPLHNRKLKVLFVGGLSQRKGISYMFESVKGLEDKVSLTVVGRKAVEDCEALNNALKQHNWIPSMPHHEVLACMQAHDVLVFPSLFEGFGMVITEAMSQGTPVITTDRTAGPDLITNNVDGWIVEPGSFEAIKKVLENLLTTPELLATVGSAAQETAKQRTWEQYGAEMAATLT